MDEHKMRSWRDERGRNGEEEDGASQRPTWGEDDGWREAAGTTNRRANEEEEIESRGVRSERKDPIMSMSGCIVASCQTAKAKQNSRSLNFRPHFHRTDRRYSSSTGKGSSRILLFLLLSLTNNRRRKKASSTHYGLAETHS